MNRPDAWDQPIGITVQLFAFGVNHQTAPLAVRERISFNTEGLPLALRDLVDH